jgi:hypothetical protein
VKAQASPIIQAEMDDWVKLGGQNWGILGAYDGSHPTGFHRAGFEVPTSDYSRRHDPGRPYNLEWASAGDFAHMGKPVLRALHAGILARLMAGDQSLSMIVEYIGMPWPDKPVMYWARWDGITNLRRYTGKGHDTWSHISWQRSRGNERAYLWRKTGPVTAPTTTAAGGAPTSTTGGKNMLVLAKSMTGDGTIYLCDGVTSRPVPAANVADVKWLASQGAIGPLWNGGDIWQGWTAAAFGQPITAPVNIQPAGSAGMSEAQLAAFTPLVVQAVKQAAREGTGT